MYLRYGSYVHDLCEATVVIDREQLDTAGGQGAGYRERWRIMGTKQAASQAALITALSALELAYFFNGYDIGIYLPDGTTLTNHYMVSSASFTGTKVVRPVSYPKGNGGEFTTFRSYEIEVEAEFRIAGAGGNDPANNAAVEKWSETLSFNGTGGPMFRYLPTINGSWQKQQVSDKSNFTVIQRGQAVGRDRHLQPRGPIWPDAEHVEQRTIDYGSADRNGGNLENFPTSWNYVFESDQALYGQPSQWPTS